LTNSPTILKLLKGYGSSKHKTTEDTSSGVKNSAMSKTNHGKTHFYTKIHNNILQTQTPTKKKNKIQNAPVV
jgi:hypothetical protein